jgi:vacuolar-type H+-ATPase subunit F/Vma7
VHGKIIVIGNSPMVSGFQLSGLEDAMAVSEGNFQKTLEDAMQNPDYGIIVVNEKMYANIDWRLKKKIDSLAYPVIIPVPDVTGASGQGEEIKNLIKRALGFDITKK